MSRRLAALLERPLRERERTRLFAVISLALVLAAAALHLAAPAHRERSTSTPAEISPPATPSPQALQPRSSAAPPAAVLRAARQFLSDYLAFLYGHARMGRLRAASASLAHRLASHTPHVSPAMRRRQHVVHLAGHRLASRSRWVLTATIADGGAVRYPIELVLAIRQSGGAVVVGLGEV